MTPSNQRIDSHRVGITGLSHGAEIAGYAISHSSLSAAAAVSQGGSWDPFEEVVANSSAYREFFHNYGLIGPNGPILSHWRRLSAAMNVERIHTPILGNESDSEYLFFLQFYSALRDHRKPQELWIYPDETHVKMQPRHRYTVYQRNLEWMRFWLQSYEYPDASKAEQYARWHKLRELQQADTQVPRR